MFREADHGDRARRSAQPAAVLASAAEAVIVTATLTQVTVTVAEWDNGQRVWGPVPYVGPQPAPGDKAFLHATTSGQPAYCVCF